MVKVLILRASGKIEPIRQSGLDVIQIPVIEVVPNNDVINEVSLGDANYVIIMSAVVVRYLGDKLRQLGKDTLVIGVGPKTCDEVRGLGIHCQLPGEFSSYGVVELMRRMPRGKVVVLRSLRGSDYVRNELRKIGHEVVEYGIYDLRPDPIGVGIACKVINYVDYVVFMSPMTYEAVRDCAREVLGGKSVIAIGRVTADRLRSDGINPLVPGEYTLNGVLNLLMGHLMTIRESPD